MKYVELNTFLKVKGIATTGGEAKLIIRNEEIKVNGEIETRNKRKLRKGDKIEFEEKIMEVTEKETLKSD